jgi:hypothetical protein
MRRLWLESYIFTVIFKPKLIIAYITVQQEEQRFQVVGKEREKGKTVGVHAVGGGGGGRIERKNKKFVRHNLFF